MAQQDWIGVGILVGSLLLLAFLLKIRFIRHHPLLAAAFVVNPGIVGVTAACAFWFRDKGPIATVLWIGAMLLTVPTTIAVMLAAPKAYLTQIKDEIEAADKADESPPADEKPA
jgi:hypothetical protein